MLEQRVARLEQILERLEPKIAEILSSGAKQAELQKVQIEIAELKGRFQALKDD
jgi:chromosome segregation ATPase